MNLFEKCTDATRLSRPDPGSNVRCRALRVPLAVRLCPRSRESPRLVALLNFTSPLWSYDARVLCFVVVFCRLPLIVWDPSTSEGNILAHKPRTPSRYKIGNTAHSSHTTEWEPFRYTMDSDRTHGSHQISLFSSHNHQTCPMTRCCCMRRE